MYQLIFGLCIVLSASATTTSPLGINQGSGDIVTRSVVSHQVWDVLLQEYVSEKGRVDYRGLQKNEARLDTYLDMLARNTPNKSWGRSEKMAYWINAYNAFTVKLILDNYPLKSIRDLDDGEVWDRKWIDLGDQTYSLNQIEHEILRKRYPDSRIHFAVNCAAASCPPLLNRAYTAEQLEAQLDAQTRAFITSKTYNTLRQQNVIVSKIFDWYSEDFGSLIPFLNNYTEVPINDKADIQFREYDWALNEQ